MTSLYDALLRAVPPAPIDLTWRAPLPEVSFGDGEPEQASVSLWPHNESEPTLFVGAQKVSA